MESLLTEPLIPLIDLQRQHRSLRNEIRRAMDAAMARGDFILGADTIEFEKEFAAYHGVSDCVGVGDGTAALQLGLVALGIGPGDEVILPANTFIATALAVTHTGARPVLVDCDPAFYTIDVVSVERALTPRTKALIPVHLYGHPAPMEPLLEMAQDRKLFVVEDAAQAHGARTNGRLCGTMGDVGCFSFYPGKNLGACGDGGAIVTRNRKLAERARMLRNYGQRQKSVHTIRGFNSRLDTLQAAILRVKLPYLDDWNEQRTRAAAQYGKFLSSARMKLPRTAAGAASAWHLYVVQAEDRDSLQAALQSARVGHGIHYPTPIHLHGAYADLGYRRGDFPAAEHLADRICSLPMFPEITREELEYVAQVCRNHASDRGFARESITADEL
jgi:dTDP-4-amino-4,6-dideoxygalactose transaminase